PPDDRPDNPDPAPLEVFVEEAWRDAAEAMQRAYRELGWAEAKVSLVGATVEVPPGLIDVRFHIEEGVRTWIRAVHFEGLPPGLSPPDLPMLRPGTPFSQSRLDEAVNATLRRLGRASYLFAQVTARPGFSADRTSAEPVLVVDPGPAVRVG